MGKVNFTREDVKEELDYIVSPKRILEYSQTNEEDFLHIYGLDKNKCNELYDFCVSMCEEKYSSWKNAIDDFVSISNVSQYINKGNDGNTPPNMTNKKYLPLIIRQVLYWIYIYFNMTSNKVSAPKILEYLNGKGISLSHNFFSEQNKSANDYLNLVTYKTPEFLINYMGQKKDENGTAQAIRHLAHQAGEYDIFIDCFGGSGAASMSINHHKNTCYVYNELDSIVYKLFKTIVGEDSYKVLINKLNDVQDIVLGDSFQYKDETIRFDLDADLKKCIQTSSYYGDNKDLDIKGIVDEYIMKHSRSENNSVELIYNKNIQQEWIFTYEQQFTLIKRFLEYTIVEDEKTYIGKKIIKSGRVYRRLNKIDKNGNCTIRTAVIKMFPTDIQEELNKIKSLNDFNGYVSSRSEEKIKKLCSILHNGDKFFAVVTIMEECGNFLICSQVTCNEEKLTVGEFLFYIKTYKLLVIYEYIECIYSKINKGDITTFSDVDVALVYVLYMYTEGGIERAGATEKIKSYAREYICTKNFDRVITNIHNIIKNTHCENMSTIECECENYLLDKYKVGKKFAKLKKSKTKANADIIKSMLLYCDSPYEATDGYNVNKKESGGNNSKFDIKELIKELAETHGKFIFSCRARSGKMGKYVPCTVDIWQNVMIHFLDMYYKIDEKDGKSVAYLIREKKVANAEGKLISKNTYYKLNVLVIVPYNADDKNNKTTPLEKMRKCLSDFDSKDNELEIMIVNYEIVDFKDKASENFAYVALDFIDFIGELYKALISDEDFRKLVEMYVQEK